jgi:acetyl-CoA C-acetyltransferase
MSKVSIIGAYNSKFGAFVQKNRETSKITDMKSIYELMIEAGQGALADAGIEGRDVDAVWVGSYAPGIFANQEHLSAFAMEIDPEGLRFKPMTRCEDACASGSVALYDAIYAVESGRIRTALVIGVEKMNLLDTRGVTNALACASYWPEEGFKAVSFPCLFAEYAKGYQARYRLNDVDLQHQLAAVAALGYTNGLDNPLAHFTKGGPSDKLGLITPEAIMALPLEKNPMIAAPLRLHDCSLVTDGAAALVIMRSDDTLVAREKIVAIAGIGHANERLPISARSGMYEYSAGKEAVRRAFDEAGITSADINLAEVHDCFTISQLLSTETLGLSVDGRAGFDYLEGRFTRNDDRCAVNLSGGLKAKGHPVGATGVSMHVMLYKQLTGDPIGAVMSKKQPEIGVVYNIGGSAVTNCVTVLKRTS